MFGEYLWPKSRLGFYLGLHNNWVGEATLICIITGRK